MRIRPLTLKEANDFVAQHHRHHKPVISHRFSLGCYDEETLVGVSIVGRPVARKIDWSRVAEVTRLCTDGTKNACSILYGASARTAKEMGFESIQTYTLADESGASLRASGWLNEGEMGGGNWNSASNNENRLFESRRVDQPMQTKRRWRRVLNIG